MTKFINFFDICFLGIIPALEPSHALYETIKIAKSLGKDKDVLVNLCGRGDKGKQFFFSYHFFHYAIHVSWSNGFLLYVDMMTVAKIMGVKIDSDSEGKLKESVGSTNKFMAEGGN